MFDPAIAATLTDEDTPPLTAEQAALVVAVCRTPVAA